MKANGRTNKEIAENTGLFRSDAHGSWYAFFLNQGYTGVFLFGGEKYCNLLPRIISDELFKAVQQQIDLHRVPIERRCQRHPRRLASSYFLSGRARCAYCRGIIIGSASKGARRYYRCKGCSPNWQISADKLEAEITDYIVKHILQLGTINELISWTNRSLAETMSDLRLQYHKVQRLVASLEAESKQMGRNFLLLPNPSASILQLMEEQKQALADQQHKLCELERMLHHTQVKITIEEVQQFLDIPRSMLLQTESDEWDRYVGALLDEIVSDITISKDNCTIKIHIPEHWL